MSIESLVAHYGLFALVLGAGLEGETVVIAGGLLAHRGLFPLGGAMAAAALGSFLADQAWFFAGRRFHDQRWVRKARTKPAFAKALDILRRHPTGFIFAFRFIYGLRTVSPIAIGTSRVPARTFLAINACAALVWGIAFTAIGYWFGEALTEALGRLRPSRHTLIWIALALAAAGLAFRLTRGWRK